MTTISLPVSFPGRAALEFLASYVQVPITLTEDPSVLIPTLSSPDSPSVFGFSATAFAIARQSTTIPAAAFLGDGDPAAAAIIEQFASIADAIVSGTAPSDIKGVLGQLQVHTKSQPFLAGASPTAADILILYAVYPTATTFLSAELIQSLGGGFAWINSAIAALPAPLAPLALGGKGRARPAPSDAGPKAAAPPPKRDPKPAPPKKEKKPAPPPAAPKDPLSLIDIRVGQIVKIWPHPGADSLYCEEVDIGGGVIRRVVTGVRKLIPIEQMENRRVLVFVNIKPSKIRGEPSESMLFAASIGHGDDERVEMLEPPAASPVGTRVTCGDFVEGGDPPVDKNGKAWKAVLGEGGENLRINADHVACYKGVPLQLPEGLVTVPSLAECEFH
jgi:tRNA-binding EMAP/Myf-like protein